jgi:hypothetical protein
MTNDLIPKPEGSTELDVFEALSSVGGGFTPRLQLFTSNSDVVKEGDVPMNHWAIVDGDNYIDLGTEVSVAILAVRAKALDTGNDIQCSHDASSELFKDIVARASVKNSGCMYGPEFLIYCPDTDGFVTLFMGSPTARREAKKMKPLLRKPAILKSKLNDNGKFKWQGPLVLPSENSIDLDMERVNTEIDKFNNPPVDTVEVAENDGRDR